MKIPKKEKLMKMSKNFQSIWIVIELSQKKPLMILWQ